MTWYIKPITQLLVNRLGVEFKATEEIVTRVVSCVATARYDADARRDFDLTDRLRTNLEFEVACHLLVYIDRLAPLLFDVYRFYYSNSFMDSDIGGQFQYDGASINLPYVIEQANKRFDPKKPVYPGQAHIVPTLLISGLMLGYRLGKENMGPESYFRAYHFFLPADLEVLELNNIQNINQWLRSLFEVLDWKLAVTNNEDINLLKKLGYDTDKFVIAAFHKEGRALTVDELLPEDKEMYFPVIKDPSYHSIRHYLVATINHISKFKGTYHKKFIARYDLYDPQREVKRKLTDLLGEINTGLEIDLAIVVNIITSLESVMELLNKERESLEASNDDNIRLRQIKLQILKLNNDIGKLQEIKQDFNSQNIRDEIKSILQNNIKKLNENIRYHVEESVREQKKLMDPESRASKTLDWILKSLNKTNEVEDQLIDDVELLHDDIMHSIINAREHYKAAIEKLNQPVVTINEAKACAKELHSLIAQAQNAVLASPFFYPAWIMDNKKIHYLQSSSMRKEWILNLAEGEVVPQSTIKKLNDLSDLYYTMDNYLNGQDSKIRGKPTDEIEILTLKQKICLLEMEILNERSHLDEFDRAEWLRELQFEQKQLLLEKESWRLKGEIEKIKGDTLKEVEMESALRKIAIEMDENQFNYEHEMNQYRHKLLLSETLQLNKEIKTAVDEALKQESKIHDFLKKANEELKNAEENKQREEEILSNKNKPQKSLTKATQEIKVKCETKRNLTIKDVRTNMYAPINNERKKFLVKYEKLKSYYPALDDTIFKDSLLHKDNKYEMMEAQFRSINENEQKIIKGFTKEKNEKRPGILKIFCNELFGGYKNEIQAYKKVLKREIQFYQEMKDIRKDQYFCRLENFSKKPKSKRVEYLRTRDIQDYEAQELKVEQANKELGKATKKVEDCKEMLKQFNESVAQLSRRGLFAHGEAANSDLTPIPQEANLLCHP